MRTVSAAWETNQEATAADRSRLNAFIETRATDTILSQMAGALPVVHGGGTEVIGQIIYLPRAFVLSDFAFKLALSGWSSGDTLDGEVWSYDIVSDELVALQEEAEIAIDADFTAAEKVYALDSDTVLAAGYYALLALAPPTGTLTGYYAVGDRYTSGERVTGATHAAESVMSEQSTEDMYFRVIGTFVDTDLIWRWRASNDAAIDNAVDARITSAFDPTGATLPIESCSITIQNEVD